MTEEQIRADLVEAQYADDPDDDDEDVSLVALGATDFQDDGTGMREQRRLKDIRRALQSREEDALFNEIISGEQDTEPEEQRVMKELGITGERFLFDAG